MKIAVVGSGLAGLHIAWLLSCPEHFDPDTVREYPEVHLIERQPTLGMDAASINVLGGKARVDVPMRSFFTQYYPRLTSLYKFVNISTERRNHSLGFFRVQGTNDVTQADTSFRYRTVMLGKYQIALPFPRISRLWADLAILFSWLRFFRMCQNAVADRATTYEPLYNTTIEQYLVGSGFSREFIDDGFYAVMSSICTCPIEDLKQYPAYPLMEPFGLGLFWEGLNVVSEGVQEVCKTLSQPVHKVFLGESVEWVKTTTNESGQRKVLLKIENHPVAEYDHVIFASQANQALRMIHDPSPQEHTALSSFRYVPTSMIVHSDTSFMPANRSEWRSINFVTFYHTDGMSPQHMSNHWMNISLPAISDDVPIFSTWNPYRRPAESKIISESRFERPLVTKETPRNLQRLWEAQGTRNRWFVGAYAFEGIPLLEGCIESGLRVAKHFGIRDDRIYYAKVLNSAHHVASPDPKRSLWSFFGWLVALLRRLMGW